jgi:hypothetical protein
MLDSSPYVLQRGAVLQRGGADPLAGLQMNSEPIPFAALSYGSQRVIVDSGVSMRPGVMALTRTRGTSSARASTADRMAVSLAVPGRGRDDRLPAATQIGPEARGWLMAGAHTLLAWTRGCLFRDSPFADADIYRIDKQHLPIRGNVVVDEGHGATLPLKPSHPPAQPRLVCLARLLERFGPPGILCKRSVTIFM